MKLGSPSSFRPASLRAALSIPAGFSLVEVTLALGLMSFALVGLLGLLPTGMTTFRSAVDSSVGTQIAQRLLSEAQQTDFNNLATTQPRYFDLQGTEIPVANKSRAIYQTNLIVIKSTALPGTSANTSLATIQVQVANNPGQKRIPVDSNNCWVSSAGVPVSSYAAYVAKNQ